MFAISPTDINWFYYLRDNNFNAEVNFWTPTPWNIKGLKIGDNFYFMLKSPIRLIGGYGEFVEYKNLTAEKAWNYYGFRNGRNSKELFISSIQKYIDANSKKFGKSKINTSTYEIGCIILKNCQFWDDAEFQQLEEKNIKFSNQIVKLKYFDDSLDFLKTSNEVDSFGIINGMREKIKILTNTRIGQAKFKSSILKAYDGKCCVTGDETPELLEASHIQPYISTHSNHTQNGILLRIDIHRLFDTGLLYIDEDYIVHVSLNLTNEFYHKFSGTKINLPKNSNDYPSIVALKLKMNNFRNVSQI